MVHFMRLVRAIAGTVAVEVGRRAHPVGGPASVRDHFSRPRPMVARLLES